MNWKKFLISGFLAGLVILIVGNIVDFLVKLAFPYNILELGGMRSADDPVMLLFFLHPWVYGFAMSFLYFYLKKSLEGDYLKKGQNFGLLIWVVASLPTAFIIYTSMDYPSGFYISQLVGSFLYMLAAGVVIAKFME